MIISVRTRKRIRTTKSITTTAATTTITANSSKKLARTKTKSTVPITTRK